MGAQKLPARSHAVAGEKSVQHTSFFCHRLIGVRLFLIVPFFLVLRDLVDGLGTSAT